jgi:hypothetical protein
MDEHAPRSAEGAAEFARAYPELAAELDRALQGELHPLRVPRIADRVRNAVTGAVLAALGVALIVITGATPAWLIFPTVFGLIAIVDAASAARMVKALRRTAHAPGVDGGAVRS